MQDFGNSLMTNTGLSTLDTTLQKTATWINELAAKLGWDNRHDAFQALRITLHMVRDRIPPEEAVELGSQLPILLSGFFYENYRLANVPTKERNKDAFLSKIQEEFQRVNIDAEPEPVVRAVFQTIAEHITQGEAKDVVHSFPQALKELWPQAVQA